MNTTQIKVNQTLCRPGQALKVPEVWSSQNSQTIGIWASYACQPYDPAVFTRVGGWVRPEGWSLWKIKRATSSRSAVTQPAAPPRPFCTLYWRFTKLKLRNARCIYIGVDWSLYCAFCLRHKPNLCRFRREIEWPGGSAATDRLYPSFLELPLASSNLCDCFQFPVATACFSCYPPVSCCYCMLLILPPPSNLNSS
jgi:hypothetical protein